MPEIMTGKNKFLIGLRELRKPKQISICGLLIALYLVVYSLNIPLSQIVQIRFGFLVLATAGLCGGPLMGLMVGALGDILSMILLAGNGGGSFFFGFTVSYALMGFICGFIFYKEKITTLRVITAGITEFLISILLNSLWLSIMYGTTYEFQVITRLPKCLIMLVINTMILLVFMKSLFFALKKSAIFA